MSLEGRSHPIPDHLRLAWAFAEILTRDEKRAEALFRTAMLEARLDASDQSSSRHRLLAAIRESYYRGEAGPRRARRDDGSEEVCGRAYSTRLGRAVDALPSEDRELLFLRYGAGLDLPAIGRISGRAPAAARIRIIELCAALSAQNGGSIGHRLASSTIH